MKKIMSGLLSVLAGCMMLGSIVLAEASATVMETYTNEADISIYVKGIGDTAEDIEVQIATARAVQVQMKSISELDVPMQTLIMLDNSLSIPEKDRGKIAELLQSIISDRLTNEEISIAVFGEDINILADYSSDYATLKRAIDNISYQNRETYLTDVLYDLISAGYGSGDVYHRIVIISDGIDNKSLGYTKDELYLLLQNTQIPIYTIGCKKKNNNEELENMFALSRLTSADAFLLDEIEDVLDITAVLKQDQEIVKLMIVPQVETMDGSRKSVKITFSDETTVSTEMTMPQQVVEKEEAPANEEPEAVKEEKEPEPMEESEENAFREEEPGFPYLILIPVGIGIIIVILVIVLILKKKNHNKVSFESIDENILRDLPPEVGKPKERTEIVSPYVGNSDDETIMMWGQETMRQLILTDIHTPMKSYQIPMNKSIVVGRKIGECDIVLDYEKSVSGRHCEICERNGKFYLKDLQSSNGTYLNQNRVLAETEIVPGSILKLGRLEMRFDIR